MGATRIQPGLLSVTFRKLSAREIVDLTVDAKLSAVEWGGDLHVPHGDVATARQVRRMCDDHGLAVSAYGSYYRAGGGPNNPELEAVLDTAEALGTTLVRVWPGTKGSAFTTDAERAAIIADLSNCCGEGIERGLKIATEFHAGTLTDTERSAERLLSAVPALSTFWQPPNGMDPDDALADLVRIAPRVSNLHVFHWWPTSEHRQPLAEGSDRWPAYLHAVAADGRPRVASLEFVANDDVEQFRRDAATLVAWLAEMNGVG